MQQFFSALYLARKIYIKKNRNNRERSVHIVLGYAEKE